MSSFSKRKDLLRRIVVQSHIQQQNAMLENSRGDDLICSGAAFYSKIQAVRKHKEEAPTIPARPEAIAEEGFHGIAGELVQLVRLSLVYALLDCRAKIRAEHLKAALAVWRYCGDSVRYIWRCFGRSHCGRYSAGAAGQPFQPS